MNTTYKHLAVIAALALVAPALTLTAGSAFAKHGADDPAGDDRGGKGKGDGPNHTLLSTDPFILMARRGADDPAGDDRRGKGKDDGINHTEITTQPALLMAKHGRDDGPNRS